jgi:hypothetical protein
MVVVVVISLEGIQVTKRENHHNSKRQATKERGGEEERPKKTK